MDRVGSSLVCRVLSELSWKTASQGWGQKELVEDVWDSCMVGWFYPKIDLVTIWLRQRRKHCSPA